MSELRKDLAIRSDEHAWRASFEAENKSLRKQLDESLKQNRSLEARYADLEERYQMLWRATHDVNYIQNVQNDEPVVWKVPASKDVVDRLQASTSQQGVRALSPMRAGGSLSGSGLGFGSGVEHRAISPRERPELANARREFNERSETKGPASSASRLASPRVEESHTQRRRRVSGDGDLTTRSSIGSSISAAARSSVTDISTFSSRQQMRNSPNVVPSVLHGGSYSRTPATPHSNGAFSRPPPSREAWTSNPRERAAPPADPPTPTDPNGGFLSGTDWLKAAFHVQPPPHERGLKQKQEGA